MKYLYNSHDFGLTSEFISVYLQMYRRSICLISSLITVVSEIIKKEFFPVEESEKNWWKFQAKRATSIVE